MYCEHGVVSDVEVIRPMTTQEPLVLRGRIWTGAGAAHALVEDGVIEVSAGTIRCVRPAESTDAPAELDQYGRPHTFLPGLVDLHNHGGGGHSFPTSDADGCGIAAQHHRSRGTTTLLASLVSAEGPALVRQAGVLSQLAEEEMVSGIHLEGPFLSSRRRGAHDPAALVPGDPELLLRIIEAARGHLRSITIAPETDNLQKLLQVCSDHRVMVSLGHSDASVAETEDALEAASAAGVAVTATHLFNAMPALDHRDPGIAGALLRAAAEGRLVAELVADGVHLDDVMVAIALSAAPAQIAFVSDAMAAAGMKDGTYTLGDSAVVVRDAVARLAAPPGQPAALAGGTSALVDQVIRHAGEVLLSERIKSSAEISRAARVVRACTQTPAQVIGLNDRGLLAPGLRADVVQLDSQGKVSRVLTGGRAQ